LPIGPPFSKLFTAEIAENAEKNTLKVKNQETELQTKVQMKEF
jgi:hypothetical protein